MSNKLDVQAIREWCDALESGEYQQGQNALRRVRRIVTEGTYPDVTETWVDLPQPHYCCLGVLCDLNLERLGARWVTRDNESSSEFYVGDISQGGGTLPTVLAKELGMHIFSTYLDQNREILFYDLDGKALDGKALDGLIFLNDDKGYSFLQIARVVREALACYEELHPGA